MRKKMPRRKNVTFHVRPRYTGGSPAMVREEIARHVAAQEKEAIEAYLEGFYGEENQARAEREGLHFIAYTMFEKRNHWHVEDLITGQVHRWPLQAQCPTCKAKRVRCERGYLTSHYQRNYGECKDRSYVGERLRDYEAALT
jgi:hypothetical protein